MDSIVSSDPSGVPRYVTFPAGSPLDSRRVLGPVGQADEFVTQQLARLLALRPETLVSLSKPLAELPESEMGGLRFQVEKRVMDSIVVGYVQTFFGLPVIGAGLSVTLRETPRAVLAATSTVEHGLSAERPSDAAVRRALAVVRPQSTQPPRLRDLGLADPADGLDEPQREMRINASRLVVFRYDARRRQGGHGHQHGDGRSEGDTLTEPPLPSVPLPPVPDTIRDGQAYVAVELYFTMTTNPWGRLNWVAYLEVTTLAVLMLAPLVDHATAAVFLRDPTTKGSAFGPNATTAQLNPLRDTVTLAGLEAAVGGVQSLSGEFVRVVDAVSPTVPVPTAGAPFNFSYDARTNNFAAANAYHQNDRFFRMVRDLGFPVATYFDGTAFPVQVDHRGFGGNAINARCPGNAAGNGIGTLEYALADLSDTGNPLGIAADWRVVLHELAGHGILWDHVWWPNFGFAHSAGDSFAAILNDPGSAAPDRFLTFPWISGVIARRHDRTPAAGWGWGGPSDTGGYNSEQVLSSTLFRLYRSIGGDSGSVPRREFAARTMAYLILRAVGQLTQATNPGNALGLEQQLEVADALVWNSTSPAETHAGGAYWKVIRWAFERQGLFKAPGAPATAEGAPPAVDVYIDDGRGGQYQFQPNHWSCTDIWNRRSAGAGAGVHEEPVVGVTNFAYVRIKNRGTQIATGVTVKGFHCLPGVGLVYPDDWAPMTTPQLPAPDLAAGDSTGAIVGPFHWTPSQVGHECMFFSVSATGDASNIDGRITGSIPEWRLVPHDNNIGQRNVHPVALGLTRLDLARRRFWLKNPFERAVRVQLAITLPSVLAQLGWKPIVTSAGGASFGMAAGASKEIAFDMERGEPLRREMLPNAETDRTIAISVEADGIPIGGMTYVIEKDYIDPNVPGPGSDKPGRSVPTEDDHHCSPEAAALLRCLKLDGSTVENVEVRKVTVDITFKSRRC